MEKRRSSRSCAFSWWLMLTVNISNLIVFYHYEVWLSRDKETQCNIIRKPYASNIFLLIDFNQDRKRRGYSSVWYSIISLTWQSSMAQNISIVFVLTLSFRFNLVIWPGLTWYVWMRRYWVMPFFLSVFQRLS